MKGLVSSILGLILTVLLVNYSSGSRSIRQVVFPDDEETPNRPTRPSSDSDCNNSPRGLGRCVRITDCHIRAQNFNQRHICGFDRFEPIVCCPLRRGTTTNRPFRTTPTRPQTRPTTRRPRPTPTTTRRPRPVVTTPGRQIDGRPSFLPRECGRSNATGRRIVGGHESEPGAFPWLVALYIEERGVKSADCGGALIAPDVVITAAHCVTSGDGRVLPASAFTVRLAEFDLSKNDDDAVDFPVSSVKRHEQYEQRTFKNDLAILKMSRKATFSANIQPICLPYDELRTENLTDRKAFIAGWGTTGFTEASSDVLRQAEIFIWDQERCRVAFRNDVNITKEYICAGTDDGSKDSCQGDSGGPLMMVGSQARFFLMGVVSFGKRCATPGYPGAYANIRMLLPWITRNAA